MLRRDFLNGGISASIGFMASTTLGLSAVPYAWLSVSLDGVAVISSNAHPLPAWHKSKFVCEVIGYGFNTAELTIAKSAKFDHKNRIFTRKAGGNLTEVLVPGECFLIFEHFSEEYTLVYSISSERFLFARLGGDKIKFISYAQHMQNIAINTADIFIVRRANAPLKLQLDAQETYSMGQGRIVREIDLGIEKDGTRMVLVKCIDEEQCSTPRGWVRRKDLERFKLEPFPSGPLPSYEVTSPRSVKACGHDEKKAMWLETEKSIFGGLEIGGKLGAQFGGAATNISGSGTTIVYPRNLQVEARRFVRRTYKEGKDWSSYWPEGAWVVDTVERYVFQRSTLNCDDMPAEMVSIIPRASDLAGPSYVSRPLADASDVSSFIREVSVDMRNEVSENVVRFIAAELASRETQN